MDELEELFNNISINPETVNHEKAVSVFQQMMNVNIKNITPKQLMDWNNYAAKIQNSKPEESIDILKLLHQYKLKTLPLNHPSTGMSYLNMATVLMNQAKFDDETILNLIYAMIIYKNCPNECSYDQVKIIHMLNFYFRERGKDYSEDMRRLFMLLC